MLFIIVFILIYQIKFAYIFFLVLTHFIKTQQKL
jgi:hypothetical protein